MGIPKANHPTARGKTGCLNSCRKDALWAGMTTDQITLAPIEPSDALRFKRELQTAFAIAVVDEYGELPDGPIPSDVDLDGAMTAQNAVTLHILVAGRRVGGAVLSINQDTQQNSLGLFFICHTEHSRGLGYRAWKAIEKRYPETLVWTTHTPYFEKRNIHFYVNKCGFKIVKFYNAQNPDPHGPSSSDFPGGDEGFEFEKIMKVEGDSMK